MDSRELSLTHDANYVYYSMHTLEDICHCDGLAFTRLDEDYNSGLIAEIDYCPLKEHLCETYSKGSGYHFTKTDQETIEQLADKANASGLAEYYVYPVIKVEKPIAFVKAGFLPTSIDIHTKWFFDYIQGVDLCTLEFWWNVCDENVIRSLKNLKRESRWVYRPLDEWKRIAASSANSLGLILFNSSLVYKGSKRPITTMDMFRTPKSFVYKHEDFVDAGGRMTINGEVWNVIPVTRYANGMSRGLFYKNEDTPKEYCGTFYYLEPESTTLLAYKSSHTSFNKYSALKELLKLYKENDKVELCEEHHKEIISVVNDTNMLPAIFAPIRKHCRGVLPPDLMITPREAWALVDNFAKSYLLNPNILPNNPYYCANFFQMYAAEDQFDQAICWLCKCLKIDALILTNMVGSFQVVTEVLDARDRVDSFKSLVYLQ